MEVINDLLNYQNLKIFQRTDAFCFSLDSVMLANFVTLNKKIKKVVDLGTGNCPIPMILTTKCDADFIGVEILKESYELGKKSIYYNKLENRIKIIHDNLIGINKVIGRSKYDLVTCNPPFFTLEKQFNISKFPLKQSARHELNVTFEQICQEASQLLKDGGYFSIVHRSERCLELLTLMKKFRLEPKRIRFVYASSSSNAEMVLIEARKNRGAELKVLQPLIIHDENGDYTAIVKEMFK